MNAALLSHLDQFRHDALLWAFLNSGALPGDDGEDIPEDEDDNIMAFRSAVGYVTTLTRMRMDLFIMQEEALKRKERREECRRHKRERHEAECHQLILDPEA